MAQTISKREAEKLLGLSGTYDKRILKKAYVTKVRTCHPDVAKAHGLDPDEAERITKQVNEAFVVLSGLFNASVTSVQCDPEPSAGSAASSAHANTRANTRTDTRSNASSNASAGSGTGTGTGAGAATGSSSYDARAAWEERKAAYAAEHSEETSEREWYSTAAAEAAARSEARRGDPRNMEAARRYTKIVTSPFYIALYTNRWVSGAVFVAAMSALGLLFGLILAAAIGPSMVMGAVEIMFVVGLIGAFTGYGSSVVESFADVHAVNKATRGL